MTTEIDYIGVMTYYEKSGFHVTPEQVTGRKILEMLLTGQAATAATWSDVAAAANQISSNNQQLETGHKYALAFIYGYSATGIAFRAQHNDWQGNHPGGMAGTTIYHKKNMMDFRTRESLPVFSASSPLNVQVYDSATATPVVVVGVIDVTDLSASAGMEDFNLWSGTTTNGTTTFTKLTIATGDTGYIKAKSVHGQCHLRGYMMTGTAPLRGQLRSTDPSLLPNPIELPYGFCTVAGDFMREVLAPLPPLTENSLIDTYATS